MAVFKTITAENVRQAIALADDPAQVDFVRGLGFRPPAYNRLVYRGKFYNPREILSIASFFATGEIPPRDRVRGTDGTGAPHILGKRGFFIDGGLLYDLRNLNLDQTHGKRAPYQYILLLWAIARAWSGQPQFVAFSSVRDELRRLLKPFVIENAAPDPAMPWAELDGTAYWELKKPGGVRQVTDSIVSQLNLIGGLSDAVYNDATRTTYTYSARSTNRSFVVAARDVLIELIVECDSAYAPLAERLIESLGLSDLPVADLPLGDDDEIVNLDNGDEILEDNEPTGAVAPLGRTTRIQDPVQRVAIERRSVEVAKAFYMNIGGKNPVEVGKPYDIRVTVDGIERRCEVKGSKMKINAVELTPNEVDHDQKYEAMDLIVVDNIEIGLDESGNVRGYGGRCRVWRNWSPADEALKPIVKYEYSLPPDSECY